MPVEKHVFTTRPFACYWCDHKVKVLGWDYDRGPICPEHSDTEIYGTMVEDYGQFGKSAGVIGDECDVTVKHGICNLDGTPRNYRSKSEMRRVAAERGLENHVTHMTLPDTDRSPHTSRWI